jgi:predicted lipoprotein
MEKLDGDEVRIRNSEGEPALRDIVQFVQFNDFKETGDFGRLAEEVLKEVPEQFVDYMIQKRIMPEPSLFNPIEMNYI